MYVITVCEKDKSIHDNSIVMFYNSASHCNKAVRQRSDLLFIATSFWFEESPCAVRTNTAGLGRLCTLFVLSTLLVFDPIFETALDRPKAGRWAHACRREGFTVASIKKDTYMCSLNLISDMEFTLNHVHYNLSIVHG